MAIPTFFHKELKASDQRVILTRNESLHALKSRRLGVGNAVQLMNGDGLVATALITSVARAELEISIERIVLCDPVDAPLTIAAAVPKGDRQKVMVDMATQLGVHKITPIVYERSITKFTSNMAEKWQRSAIEACKQSQNPWLPIITDAMRLPDFLRVLSGPARYCDANGPGILESAPAKTATTLFIGPEGGFSDAELTLFLKHAVTPLYLGAHILRTETAVLTAVSQWQQFARSC